MVSTKLHKKHPGSLPELVHQFALAISLIGLLAGCNGQPNQLEEGNNNSVVQIVKTGNQYQLLRNGEPYHINGAGGYNHYSELKKRGGNSIRVWDTNDAGRILDEAHKLGLTVCMGIWMTREREGFDYDNKRALEKQREQIRRDVIKYKDHPALLMWNIGNEMNAESTNVRVWDAVNDIAEMIQEIDPNHPTTTSVFDVHSRTVRLIRQRCPNIDILSVNAYGGISTVPDKIRKSSWDGPYLITEYGAKGDWEAPLTAWKQPIEQTSSQKAHFIRERYEEQIKKDTSLCLGSYVFLWGHKQEQTHTWFSLFSEKGEKTEMVDMMQYLWTGEWPENKAPHILDIYVNEEMAGDSMIIHPNSMHTAEVIAYDEEGDSLRYEWEILPEVELEDGAVDRLKRPEPVKDVIIAVDGARVQWKAPEEDGEYRLFATVYDGNNSIGTANVPFMVKGQAGKLLGRENQNISRSRIFVGFQQIIQGSLSSPLPVSSGLSDKKKTF